MLVQNIKFQHNKIAAAVWLYDIQNAKTSPWKLVSEIHRATSDSKLRWKLIILSSIKHDLGAGKWIIHLCVKNEKPEKFLLGTWPTYLVGKSYYVIMLVFLFMFYFFSFFMYYSSDHLLGVDALIQSNCMIASPPLILKQRYHMLFLLLPFLLLWIVVVMFFIILFFFLFFI